MKALHFILPLLVLATIPGQPLQRRLRLSGKVLEASGEGDSKHLAARSVPVDEEVVSWLSRRVGPELHLDRAFISGIPLTPMTKDTLQDFNSVASESERQAHIWLSKYHREQADEMLAARKRFKSSKELERYFSRQIHQHHVFSRKHGSEEGISRSREGPVPDAKAELLDPTSVNRALGPMWLSGRSTVWPNSGDGVDQWRARTIYERVFMTKRDQILAEGRRARGKLSVAKAKAIATTGEAETSRGKHSDSVEALQREASGRDHLADRFESWAGAMSRSNTALVRDGAVPSERVLEGMHNLDKGRRTQAMKARLVTGREARFSVKNGR